MPKPPTNGGSETQTQAKSAQSNLRITRSATATQAAANGKPISQQSTKKDLSPKEQNNGEKSAEVNVGATTAARKPATTLSALLKPIVEALYRILDGEDSTERIIEGIFRYIKEAEKAERIARVSKEREEIQEEVSTLRKGFTAELCKVQEDLNNRLNGITGVVNVTLETSEKALKVAEEVKGSARDILNKLGKVTNVADKIADTTQSYRDALVNRQTPSLKANADPKVLGDIDRRAKQLLVDVYGDEGNATLEKSLTEIISKANRVLDGMTDGNKPEEVKVEVALKTKRNAVLLTLNTKEAANWIREVGNEETFADAFSKGAHIREREYILVAPRIPLTFEPENQTHLREVEEANSLPAHTIRKARWIKLAGRRRTGQTHAHAILSITSVNVANKLIKDGVGICGSLIRPTKQKQEPIQCMKCRRWGHFADSCPENEDTCGTCGDKHRTNACTNNSKCHCVSCGVNSHASWDRQCPEFIRRCAVLDERNPVNSMPFFPAEQDWTLAIESRPSRIPFEERFPPSYAVNSLPSLGGRKTQRGKGAGRRGQPSQSGSNTIPITDNNRYNARAAGGSEKDDAAWPKWAQEPIDSDPTKEIIDSDVTFQTKEWI